MVFSFKVMYFKLNLLIMLLIVIFLEIEYFFFYMFMIEIVIFCEKVEDKDVYENCYIKIFFFF